MSSITVAGVARDCGQYLETVLQALGELENFFDEVRYVFVENDSRDNTKQALKQFASRKTGVYLINLDGLSGIQERTERIARCRNAYTTLIAETHELSQSDYVLVVDMDDVNTSFSAVHLFEKAIPILESESDLGAVFPNQLPNYYDLWALRHQALCDGDIFFDLAQRVYERRRFDEPLINEALIGRVNPLNLPVSGGVIFVDSAFGGLGLYKSRPFQEFTNSYRGLETKFLCGPDGIALAVSAEVCEHVSFHSNFRKQKYSLGIVTDWVTNDQSHYRALPHAFAGLYRRFDGVPVFTLGEKA